MVIRFVRVGGEALPLGRQVMIGEGDREIVVQVPEEMMHPLLASALSQTVTDYARVAWIYAGDTAIRDQYAV